MWKIGSEKLKNLPSITELLNDRAGIQTHILWSPGSKL